MKNALRTASFFAFICAISSTAPAYAQQTTGVGANYETRLSNLEDSFRDLNGKIEQLEFAIHRMEQSVQRLQTDTDARLNKLEFPPTPPATVIAPPATPAPATPTPTPNGTLGSLRMQQDGKVTGGSVSPQSPPLPETPADYGLTPQEQYDRAFGMLRQANYEEAESAFKQFIEKNPKDKLIDNAKYWYGETLYVRGRFDEAAVGFADAYQQNPKGSKAPDSLLKLAMSLEGMNKVADACTTLAELKLKYPNAPASIKSRADEERSKAKCSK